MVDNAGLTGTLKDSVNLTLFAPSNNAINSIDPAIITELNNDPNGLLRIFLGRHLYNEVLASEDMFDNLKITMSNGEDVLISVRFDGLYINDARIITEDIVADNGIIHIVSSVVNPLRVRISAYDIVSAESNLSTFKSAIDSADLVEALSDNDLISVFAPSNDAFDALGTGVLAELMADPNGLLTDLLKFHYNHELVLTSFLFDGSFLTMNNGNVVNVTINTDGIFLNDAKITTRDIICDNGVVHILDAVIMPIANAFTVYDLVSLNENLTIFKSAIDTASLQDLLATGSNLTVFAPTDNAFNKIPQAVLTTLFENENDTLRTILLGHIIEGKIFSRAELLPNIQLDLENNTIAVINLRADGLYFNNAKILIYDVQVDNGVVHIIDAVNLPISTSISDLNTEAYTLELSPNPSHDMITLSCDVCEKKPIAIRLLNTQGQLVKSISNYEWNNAIDISDLTSGVYHAVFNNKKIKATSFVKE
jgi:uncharacterized surface protein with fasciclin (FAS1) repeats